MPPAARGHQTLSTYISARFDEFSRSQKDVAQYVVDHLDEVAFHTAEELARRANTSSSTVVRFSQALGFEGFPELQEAAREEYRHHHRTAKAPETATPLFSLDQSPFEQAVAADHVNVEDTARRVSRSEVEGAIEAIAAAERILIAGTDQMAFFASYLRHLLMLLDVRAEIAASPSQEALSRLGRIDERTLVIGLSAGRPHPLVVRAMKIARHRRAATLAIVDATLSDVSKLAERTLYYSLELARVRALPHRPAEHPPGAGLRRLRARRRAVRRPHPRVPLEVASTAMLGLRDGITGCLFDLDGVLTDTARLHARAWKQIFEAHGQPFDEHDDYDELRRRQAARGRDPRLPRLARRPRRATPRSRRLGDEKNDLIAQADPRRRRRAVPGLRPLPQGGQAKPGCGAPACPPATTRTTCSRSPACSTTSRRSSTATSRTSCTCAASPRPTRSWRAPSRLSLDPAQCAVFEDALAGRRRRPRRQVRLRHRRRPRRPARRAAQPRRRHRRRRPRRAAE